MVKANTSEPNENKDPQNKNHRIFKNILDNAQKHWGEIFYDHAGKLARGLLVTKDGTYPSELSYDDQKRYLSLVVRLRVNDVQSMTQRNTFLRFQNQCSQLLCFVTYDDEDSVATIRAKTTVPVAGSCMHAVGSIFKDTLSLLDDSNFHQLLN